MIMTTGIYQLNFNDQAFYIGQSLDIEQRWKQHSDKFRKGTAAQKMQYAYDQLGMPKFYYVLECHKDYLDIMEGYYISVQKTYPNCLNSTAPKLDPAIDYQWLVDYPHMLKYSSFEIMTSFIQATHDKTALQEAHEDLQHSFNKEFMLHKAMVELRDGKDENAELVKDYHGRLLNAQQKLNKLHERGILKRIFNYG